MAKTPRRSKNRGTGKSPISLADQLFVAATRRYARPEDEFLPPLKPERAAAIAAWRERYHPQSPSAPESTLLRGKFARGIAARWVARAALFIVSVAGALLLFTHVFDDTIRIEDELGKSAMGSEFGAEGRPVQLRVMRKRHKIGEITVAHGSRLKIVKASNGDAFRSEMAFSGVEADFKLHYKGKASVIVKNGPFEAQVRIAPESSGDVHLKFRELPNPLSVKESQFAIEVIKGSVQIAEADEGDEFEHYREGEKAVFSFEDSESL